MTTERKRTSVILGGILAGFAVAGTAAVVLTEDRVQPDNPSKEIEVSKGNVDVRLDHKGGIAWFKVPGENRYIEEQDYFARKLSVAFEAGKVDEADSCVKLSYHFSAGNQPKGLELNGDVVQTYIAAVPMPQKISTLSQLQRASARIANGDPQMQGPISFMANEVCGAQALQAHPEALKQAETAYKEANSWTNKLKFW